MDIIYDVGVLGWAHIENRARTGVYRVVETLARGVANDGDCRVRFCTSADNAQHCLDYLNTVPAISRYGSDLVTDIPSFFAQRNKFVNKVARLFRRQARTIYHSPFYPIPQAVWDDRSVIKVQTIYDLIPVIFPQFFAWQEDESMRSMLRSLTPETFVTCISESTKADLCNYAPHIDPAKVFVTHLAAADDFHCCSDTAALLAVREKYGLPEGSRYIMSLCTLEPRKNIELAIKSFARLVHEQSLPDLYLVLAGTKGWKYEKILEEIEHAAAVKERIILTGFVPDEDLAPLYSGALAFVYMSLYEGFGLPPLEAMQCGVPVITSNTSSLPEVVGDAGIMLDPLDGDALCQAMLRLYRDGGLREGLAARALERAKLFSWEKCVNETIEVYREAVGCG